MMQTVVQQLKLSQKGVWCDEKQLPALGDPHEIPPSQIVQVLRAMAAQVTSHWTVQQKLSIAQTSSQQFSSEQAGPPCGAQHSPASWSPQRGSGQGPVASEHSEVR
jgi:hypothetical protein